MSLGTLESANGRGLPPPGLSSDVAPATGVGRSLDRLQDRMSRALMRQLYLNIPVMGRAISILAGLAGCPRLQGEDEAHTEDLTAWWENVRAGWGGMGGAAFLADHTGQALLHGYGIAEAEISEGLDEVVGLWSYRSEHFRFSTQGSQLQIVQRNAYSGSGSEAPIMGGRRLSPITACVSTSEPQGSDPRGQPLFLACPTIAQVWTEALMAHKATWRRMGIPVFHVNLELPENFTDDAKWTKTQALLTIVSKNLNDAVKSQVERGIAKDVYSAGKVTISVVGLEGMAMDFQISKRQLMEELVVASDVPPSLFGYAWSSTERMSSVQMRKLVGRIWAVRRSVEPAVRHLVNLRQRLRGETRAWKLIWPDTNLADLVETSQAALFDANAKLREQVWAVNNWLLGAWDQPQVVEHITGSPEVKQKLEAPPALASAPQGSGPTKEP